MADQCPFKAASKFNFKSQEVAFLSVFKGNLKRILQNSIIVEPGIARQIY